MLAPETVRPGIPYTLRGAKLAAPHTRATAPAVSPRHPQPAFDLATRCPRLAKAHRDRHAEMWQQRRARRQARARLLHTEWLVAHRELELCRAQASGSRRRIDDRARKLGQAMRELAQAQRRAHEVGA